MPAERYWQVMRTASRRLSWGIADQGVSSATNFLLSSLVARSLGAEQFGAFTLAYVTYGFAGNASRGLSIEPLLVRFSGSSLPVWRRATAESTGTALVVGLVLGICALAVAPLIGGTTGHAFLALGLTFPGLLLQDSWRFAFFAIGRGSKALVNDLVWAGVEIPVLVFLKLSGHANVFWFTLSWGGAACVAAVFGSFQAKVVPKPLGSLNWLVRHRDLGPRYFVENTGPNIADIVRSYSITSILGLVAVGCIQAANVLMGPFKIILIGTSLITIPEGARLLRRAPHRLPAFCAAISAGLTLMALAWGALLLIALPHGLGHLALGSVWRPAYPLVLPTVLSITGACAGVGAITGMHVLGASARSMRSMLLTAGLVVVGVLVGAVTYGAIGTVSAAACAAWIGTLVAWWQLRQAFHESETVSVPVWMWPPTAEASVKRPAQDPTRWDATTDERAAESDSAAS
jgi:O-antigen/teichoic acid export membrane protein